MIIILIIAFILFPFISIPLILLGIGLEGKKHPILYSILLSIPFAIIAYNVIPDSTKDLYRYYVEMDYIYSRIDLGGYIQIMFNNTKLLFNTLQFIFTKIGNYNLLPFFITLVGYSISFYCILDYSKVKNIKSKYTLIVLLSFICIFYHINFISGLAQYLAISISFLAFYLEFIKGKKKLIYKLLYVIPCLIHISLFMGVIFRLLMCFEYKKIKKIYIVMLMFYVTLPSIFVKVFSSFTLFSSKIDTYMISGTRNFSSLYDIFTLILFFVTFIFVLVYNKKNKNMISNEYKNFGKIIMLFILFSIPYGDIFLRFFNLLLLYFNLYLLECFEKFNKSEKLFLVIGLIIFNIIFGSVNINNFKVMNFGEKFKFYENIFYFLH